MKILKIRACGLQLLKKEIEIDFFAKQRVQPEKNEMLTNVFSNIYINNVMSVVGINASGKTTTLKIISFVLQMLQNKPINAIEYKDILNGLQDQDVACFEVYFISEDEKLKKLETCIKVNIETEQFERKYFITSEKIWSKSLKSRHTKTDLYNFSQSDLETERNDKELFLLDDVSVIIAFNKKQKEQLFVIDSIDWTNINGLRVLGDFPITLVRFLDPSIEYLVCKQDELSDKKLEMHLKFFERKEIVLHSPSEVNKYLSSGTIKGINIFMTAIVALQKGGYIIIDELENHFNKEIVSTLIRFFMDKEVNKSGAVLIFSTHYVELLDIFERNDNIFVVKNKGGITLENLADLLKRNDVKKSELFQSGYLECTTPSYESYINFKRAITKLPEANEV
ncbi:MAG: ATP-binding protein [Bacilli bacterium]